MKKPATVDEYIASYPAEVRVLLEEMRKIIKAAAPQAIEVISYSMPAFKQSGMLVWFGAHTNHIGFYPRASGIEAFKEELSAYKNAKGSVQFPFAQPLPAELIKKIVHFRIAENLKKQKTVK